MLIDEIRKRRNEAMKSRDTVAKEVLGVALGDIDTIGARASRDATDEECQQVLRKLVKSNEETRAVATDEVQKQTLAREIEILASLLPATLGVPEVVQALGPVVADIRAAGNDGQATGVAMKHLKTTGSVVDGKIVSQAVKQMRS